MNTQLFSQKYFLHVVIGIFLFICLININSAALWRDEAFSALTAQQEVSEIINTAARDNQPPLHFLLLKLTGQFIGYSEPVLRLWSVFAMSGVLFFTYLISLNYAKKKDLAGWTLILLAVNPITFIFALEARAYALLMLATVISVYSMQKYLIAHDPRWLAALSLALLAGMYLHNIFAIPLSVVLTVLFIESFSSHKYRNLLSYFKRNRFLPLVPIIVVLGFLPWASNLLTQFDTISSNGFWYNFNFYRDFFMVITMMFTSDFWNPELSWMLILFLPVASLALVSVFYGWFKELKNFKKKFPLATVLSLAPMVLIYALSFKVPLMYYRYLVFILPFFTILIVNTWRKKQLITLIFAVLLVFVTTYCLTILPYKKENYPKLLANIHFDTGYDAVLTNNAQVMHGFKYYSKLPIYIDAKPESVSQFDGKAIIKDTDYWKEDTTLYTRIWVPYIAEWNADSITYYKDQLAAKGFHEAFTIRVSNALYLSLFDRRIIKQ